MTDPHQMPSFKHHILMSTLSASSVGLAYVRLATQGKARAEYVRPEKMRATQDYLHNKYKGTPATTLPKACALPMDWFTSTTDTIARTMRPERRGVAHERGRR
jgi:hypothetical protein